ncbi:MAG: acyl-CoA dehydrogenase [Burkholderiales bacterium]
MNFSYTEEQQLLRDSIARFIQKDYTFDIRRAIYTSPEGWSKKVWAQLAEMGLLGLSIPAEYDGFGESMVDAMVAMTAVGNGLVVEPYLATVVLSAGAIAAAGSDAQKAALLPRVVDGSLTLALATIEPGGRYNLNHVTTRATRNGDDYVLAGAKAVVAHGGQADKLVVSARTAGADTDPRGISLFVVDATAAGVTRRDARTIDGQRVADISLANVRVPASALLGEADAAAPILERVVDRGVAALCAEAVGVMETLNAQTVEYLKTRQQFGQPIGRFQVLQHRAVDMFIHLEQCRSMAILAAMKVDTTDRVERIKAVAGAKVHIGESGRTVAQSAIQLHGGMGVTNEMPAAHYAKRLTMIDFQLGDSQHHLDRFIGVANGVGHDS